MQCFNILIIKCLLGSPVETTEGKQTREFNFVDNLVDAFLSGGEAKAWDGPVNVGSNNPIAICDLARKIHELSNSESDLRIGALPNRPTEIWNMCADSRRGRELLGWQPKVSFDEGLRITIDWFRQYIEVFYTMDSGLSRL